MAFVGKSFCTFVLLVSCGILSLGTSFASADDFDLVKDGQAQATIVVPVQASIWEMFAAERFQRYVEKISGAKLAIKKESDAVSGKKIFIGHTRASSDILKRLIDQNNPDETSMIVAKSDAVHLIGIDDEGTMHATYFVLEDFGCRWYFPTEWGTVIPQSKTLTIPQQETLRVPSFKIRSGIASVSVNEDNDASWTLWEWGRGNHLGGWTWWGGGHSYEYLVPASNFDAHPEWFAFYDGARHPDQLCTTNPEVRNQAWKTLEAMIKDHYKGKPPRLICISPNDNNNFCQCPNCLKLVPERSDGKGKDVTNSIDRIVEFANFIAEKLAKDYPQCYVTYYCNYHSVGTPKLVTPAKNTVFWLTHWAEDQFHGINETTRLGNAICEWKKYGNPLFVYTYWGSYGSYHFWPAVHAIAGDIPYFYKNGTIGVYSETHPHWGGQHLNFIVFPRLLFDVNTDVEAWIDDFCSRFYGPAAQSMRDYYRRLEQVAQSGPAQYHEIAQLIPVFTPQVMKELRRNILKARKLAHETGEPYRQRMEFVYAGFELGDWYFTAKHLERRYAQTRDPAIRARVVDLYGKIRERINRPEYKNKLIEETLSVPATIENDYAFAKTGTTFAPGNFRYTDSFIQGGRTYLDAVKRSGLIDGWWGLDMDSSSEGTLIYKFKAEKGMFKTSILKSMNGAWEQIGVDIAVRTAENGPWKSVTSTLESGASSLPLPIDLTQTVKDNDVFWLRINLKNRAKTYIAAFMGFELTGDVVQK